jgi:arsenite methyltransferase
MTESGFSYFDMQSVIGITKHMGGLAATEALLRACDVNRDSHILVVGCGAGATPRFIAKKYGCRVAGVDIAPKMIAWAEKRAQREGVQGLLEFKVADAQSLPYGDNLFDAVCCESVLAFVPDKSKAATEYVRVTKPGGHVAVNECTWMAPPPDDLADYTYRIMAGARFLTSDGWRDLLTSGGLVDVGGQSQKITMLSQFSNELQTFSTADWLDSLGAWKTFVSLFLHNPAFRQYTRKIVPSRRIISNLFAYLGYGIYAGHKQR